MSSAPNIPGFKVGSVSAYRWCKPCAAYVPVEGSSYYHCRSCARAAAGGPEPKMPQKNEPFSGSDVRDETPPWEAFEAAGARLRELKQEGELAEAKPKVEDRCDVRWHAHDGPQCILPKHPAGIHRYELDSAEIQKIIARGTRPVEEALKEVECSLSELTLATRVRELNEKRKAERRRKEELQKRLRAVREVLEEAGEAGALPTTVSADSEEDRVRQLLAWGTMWKGIAEELKNGEDPHAPLDRCAWFNIGHGQCILEKWHEGLHSFEETPE